MSKAAGGSAKTKRRSSLPAALPEQGSAPMASESGRSPIVSDAGSGKGRKAKLKKRSTLPEPALAAMVGEAESTLPEPGLAPVAGEADNKLSAMAEAEGAFENARRFSFSPASLGTVNANGVENNEVLSTTQSKMYPDPVTSSILPEQQQVNLPSFGREDSQEFVPGMSSSLTSMATGSPAASFLREQPTASPPRLEQRTMSMRSPSLSDTEVLPGRYGTLEIRDDGVMRVRTPSPPGSPLLGQTTQSPPRVMRYRTSASDSFPPTGATSVRNPSPPSSPLLGQRIASQPRVMRFPPSSAEPTLSPGRYTLHPLLHPPSSPLSSAAGLDQDAAGLFLQSSLEKGQDAQPPDSSAWMLKRPQMPLPRTMSVPNWTPLTTPDLGPWAPLPTSLEMEPPPLPLIVERPVPIVIPSTPVQKQPPREEANRLVMDLQLDSLWHSVSTLRQEVAQAAMALSYEAAHAQMNENPWPWTPRRMHVHGVSGRMPLSMESMLSQTSGSFLPPPRDPPRPVGQPPQAPWNLSPMAPVYSSLQMGPPSTVGTKMYEPGRSRTPSPTTRVVMQSPSPSTRVVRSPSPSRQNHGRYSGGSVAPAQNFPQTLPRPIPNPPKTTNPQTRIPGTSLSFKVNEAPTSSLLSHSASQSLIAGGDSPYLWSNLGSPAYPQMRPGPQVSSAPLLAARQQFNPKDDDRHWVPYSNSTATFMRDVTNPLVPSY